MDQPIRKRFFKKKLPLLPSLIQKGKAALLPPRSESHIGDRFFFVFLKLNTIAILILLALLFIQICVLSWPAISHFGLAFLTSTKWNPVTETFGALPFLYGTLVSSCLAVLLATPLCIGTALFITELCPPFLAPTLSFLIEMLAAIPSVVYGLWGVFVLVPWVRSFLEPLLGHYLGWLPLFQGPPYGIGMLSASLILAMMISPTITAMSREVFLTIPRHQKEAVLALGATRFEMFQIALLKGGRFGLFSAVLLGLGRALGETMAVTMVIGNRSQIALSLFAPAQTLASAIANEYTEADSDLHLASLTELGLVLFLISIFIFIVSRILIYKLKNKGMPKKISNPSKNALSKGARS